MHRTPLVSGYLSAGSSSGEAQRRKAALCGHELSPKMLANVDYYVEQFCRCSPLPRWFAFGHTHRQGAGTSPRHGIKVFNVGSCYVDQNRPITFLEIEAGAGGSPVFRLMCVDAKGTIRAS